MSNKPAPILMSEAQVREVKSEISNLEKMWEADRRSKSPLIQDEAEFMGEIAKKRKLLAEHAPKEFDSPAEQNRAYDEWKKLAEEITDKLPTQKDYYRPAKKDSDTHHRQYDFDNAVRHQVQFMQDKGLQEKIRNWKYLGKRIDPKNPDLHNIEILRRRG